MATGMWTAVSGAKAQSQVVDTVANNLANADTLGFKKDETTFKEYMAALEREHTQVDVPRSPIKDKDLYPLDGRDQSFVVVDGTYTNFKPGSLKVTQVPLDVAMDGPGFLEVSTPSGIRYTKAGSLKMAMDGRLVTSDGYPVLAAQPGGLAARTPATVPPLGQGGSVTQGGVTAGLDPTVAARFISLKDVPGKVTIDQAGDIYSGDQLIAKLSVAEFRDLTKLRKSGGLLFENKDSANISTDPLKTVVRQGVLETSNVNPVQEMTDLIKANRLFEEDLKAMRTYNELMGRESNDIGKL